MLICNGQSHGKKKSKHSKLVFKVAENYQAVFIAYDQGSGERQFWASCWWVVNADDVGVVTMRGRKNMSFCMRFFHGPLIHLSSFSIPTHHRRSHKHSLSRVVADVIIRTFMAFCKSLLCV